MRPRGLLLGLLVSCALWAVILVPLLLWGEQAMLVGSIFVSGMLISREVAKALRAPREPKPDYIEIDRLERELGMQPEQPILPRGQVTYHGHAGPCSDGCSQWGPVTSAGDPG